MATETRHRGTLRTDLEANLARLGDLPVMESDRDRLLHRLVRGSEGTVRSLLENHVLTVLADIRRKRLKGYPDTFADSQGTAEAARYAKKLRGNIEGWVKRLGTYTDRSWRSGYTGDAVKVAQELSARLKATLTGTDKEGWYKMFRTVSAIQEESDRYRRQAEESGDTEPSLALLLAYLKNYAGIAETFNHRLASLPGLYLKDILHARPKTAEPDNTYAVITPTETAGGFTLAKGTAFPAGEELTYRTGNREYVSPVRCTEVHAIHLQGETLHKSPLLPDGETQPADSLFPDGQPVYLGWQIESPMLVFGEGKHEVCIRFHLAADSVLPDDLPENTVNLQLSGEEGWMEQPCRCSMENNQFCIFFTVEQTDAAITACTEEVYGTDTAYPALRILTDQPRWTGYLRFSRVEIEIKASGIRNFTFSNELGEADLSQAVLPFGIQAEQGARFLFACEEMAQKPLSEVELKGKWQKLPATRKAFDTLYTPYSVKSSDFTISTACKRQDAWQSHEDKQPLLEFDSEGNLSEAKVQFRFDKAMPTDIFRVTLETPAIGFGTAAYRKLFTEVMIHNSRCKEKERKPMPEEPPVPRLCDMELSYTSIATIPVEEEADNPSRLSRITALSEQETFPARPMAGAIPFLLPTPAAHLLLFAFTRAEQAKSVRMYIDTTLPPSSIPFGSPQPDKQVRASWELWNGHEWQTIPSESVKAEETNGFTQSGFVEIDLPQTLYTDRKNRLWLRAALSGDTSACLTLRGVWTNSIRVTAENGDGSPLPAGTLQQTEEPDERIEGIVQPLPGFGGRTAETEEQCTLRQQMRLHNRHRAVTMKDYEELVLEHFPEIDKAQCITLPKENAPSEICIVVFSRTEDSRYFLSPAWKLKEIRRTVSRYAPPFVTLKVVNPQYEKITVDCKVVLRENIQDEGRVLRQLTVLAQNCIAPWLRTGEIPDSGDTFSYKELHARLANHEALLRLASLKVDGFSLPDTGIGTKDRLFRGEREWGILLPEINIKLLSSDDGIEEAEIGGNFIIR